MPELFIGVSDEWTLNLTVTRPRRGIITLRRCGPDDVDGHSFSVTPSRDVTYDTTYWERSNASGVCVRMPGSCTQTGLSLQLDDYDATSDSVVSGSFEGTIYEDEDRNSRRLGQPCSTSKPIMVRGGFLGRLSLQE